MDDILAISHNSTSILKAVQVNFEFKDDKIAQLETYLGAQLGQMEINKTVRWYMSSEFYVRAAITNIEETLSKSGQKLPNKCKTPLSWGYQPELDVMQELKADGLHRYQELVGVLKWAVKLGRVDILLQTAMMSTHLALPRKGHLEQLYHIFGYLKTSPKRKLFFNPQYPDVDERSFSVYDWHNFYRDAGEAIPADMPPPRGQFVSTHCFVDSDHAGNTVTRRSQTGVLLFVNRAPIV